MLSGRTLRGSLQTGFQPVACSLCADGMRRYSARINAFILLPLYYSGAVQGSQGTTKNDSECPPRCFGHPQRKNYFKFRDIGTPAGVPISHFHGRGRRGRRHLQRRFLRKRGAAEKASTSLQQAEPSQARERERTERVCRPLWGSWQSRQALTERASLLTKKAAATRILHMQKEPLHMVSCSGSFFMIAYFRLNFSGSKSGSSQKRVMISV